MRERAKAAGLTLSLHSVPSTGATVRVEAPLPPEQLSLGIS